MLDLESDEWRQVSCGVLVAQLLQRLSNGDASVCGELHHQVCHQNSVSEVAYVAAPHVVRIARQASLEVRVLLLGTIGSIVASAIAYHRSAAQPHPEWIPEYKRACADARVLAADVLLGGGLERWQSLMVIGTLAALDGHANLALLLEFGVEPECPACGEPIVFGERA